MTEEHGQHDQQGPKVYPAEKARQGEIILKHKSSRFFFVAGFVVILGLAVIVYWL